VHKANSALIWTESSFNFFACLTVGWCWQREKIGWQEPSKFDVADFYFSLSLVIFHKTLASGEKIKF